MQGAGVLHGQQMRALHRVKSWRARGKVTLGGIASPLLPAARRHRRRHSTHIDDGRAVERFGRRHTRLGEAGPLQQRVKLFKPRMIAAQEMPRVRDLQLDIEIGFGRSANRGHGEGARQQQRRDVTRFRIDLDVGGCFAFCSDSSTSAQVRSRGLSGFSAHRCRWRSGRGSPLAGGTACFLRLGTLAADRADGINQWRL